MQSDFDLRYNISALAIAILRPDVVTVEQAFSTISSKSAKLTNEDVLDMIAMREQGMTNEEIGKVYGFRVCSSK